MTDDAKTNYDFPAWEPSEGAVTLDELIQDAARHWDGADEHEWKIGEAVLAGQVDLIYKRQHQPWHDKKTGKHGEPMFAEDVVKYWIESAIKRNALSLREYLRRLNEKEGHNV